jgi:starch phosphorylase
VTACRAAGYSPADFVAKNVELRRAIEMIDSGYFTPGNLAESKAIADRLLADGEPFLVLADFEGYDEAQSRVDALYRDADAWSRRAVINSLSMGPLSSDRSIREYADRIWQVKPVL